MQYFYVIIVLCVAVAVTAKLSNNGKYMKLGLDLNKLDLSNVKQKWIEQPLNQYDPHENRTLRMRYFENLEYWQPNGPIYLFIGGEAREDGGAIVSIDRSLIVQLAKETNGAMFCTEHRYYGDSLPDLPNNDKIKYFKYLSSKQALADIAILIMTLKNDPKFANSPVVVIGGSYPGNLATWMRLLYPDLVDAAVASSAPVLAKKDFHEYLDVVRYTYGKYGTENCLENIEKKFKRCGDLFKSSVGIETLKKEFRICPGNDLTVLENQQCFFNKLYNRLTGSAQYGPPSDVKMVCSEYGSNKTLMQDYEFNSKMLRQDDDDYACVDVTDCWVSHKDDLAWTYQYCTEFGYLQTTSSEKQPFVHWSPLEFWFKICKDLVDGNVEKKIDEGVAKTNKMYGGRNPKVSKVVFTHGDMDPWHSLGVLQDLGPDAPVIMVNGTAHCGILSVGDEEPEEMKEKRKYVKELIKKWILNK